GPVLVDETASAATRSRKTHINLFELAYEKIEELIVTMALRPGQFLSINDVQSLAGFGRTPVHQAVTRLAGDTLIIVRPRHGLQIAPIDLSRERMLLRLRSDIERFVVQLAAERSSPSHRNQMLHMTRALRERRASLNIGDFNRLDRRIDKLVLAAAGEPFLESALRPLHTIFRRIGFMHHSHIAGDKSLLRTIDSHIAVLDAVANRHVDRAANASDELITFLEGMFDEMESTVDPSLLDCSVEPLLGA